MKPPFEYSKNPSSDVYFFSNRPIINTYLFSGFIHENGQNPTLMGVQDWEGSWSFALYDANKNAVEISRDRVGARSIYYYENEEVFVFSNQITAIIKSGLYHPVASSSAVYRWLFMNQSDYLSDCLFEDIEELAPSKQICYNLSSKTYSITDYYQFKYNENQIKANQSVKNELKELIENSVQLRVRQDSKLASLLSGGLDSSIIASCLANHGKGFPLLTAMSAHERFNETQYAQTVVSHNEFSNWHLIQVGHIEQSLEELHKAMELPTLSLGSLLQFELFRFAKFQNINLILDGTGADAIFAGHQYYKAIYWMELMRKKKWKLLYKELKSRQGPPFWVKFLFKNWVKYQRIPNASEWTKAQFLYRNNKLSHVLNPDFLHLHKGLLNENHKPQIESLNHFLQDEFFNSARILLRFMDRLGQYFQVNSSSLFSEDSKLFEYGLHIPSELKIQNEQLKYILRKSFENKLPEVVLKRNDKMGLVAPNNLWMKENKEFLLSYLDQDLSEYFNMSLIKDVISKEIDESPMQENYKIFKYLSFAIWHKVFIS